MESLVYRRPASIGVENYRHWAFVQPPAVATLSSAQGTLEALLNWLVRLICGSRRALGALSLGGGRYLSTFGSVVGILAKF